LKDREVLACEHQHAKEKTEMLKRVLLPAVTILAIGVIGIVCGQQREQLRHPVYHVLKSAASNRMLERGPAPILEQAPVAAAAPLSQTAPVSDDEPVAEVASSIPPVAAPSPSLPAVPEAPQLSKSRIALNEAIEDARGYLQHIEENVRDYTCLFIKQENVKGEVLPPEFIRLKVRSEVVENGQVVVPFSAYFKFLKPNECKNREVLYVAGRYGGGKLLAKEGSGGRRFLPAMTLRISSPFVMATNRYPITEIGVKTLTQRLIDRSEQDPDVDSCEITYASGAKMDGRKCKFLQVKRPTPKVGPAAELGMNVYLAQVFIDEELQVPVRYAAYDWPKVEGGSPEVVESYTYKDLKINVGLTDADFDPKNPEYNF
jgi:hypothetical protein